MAVSAILTAGVPRQMVAFCLLFAVVTLIYSKIWKRKKFPLPPGPPPEPFLGHLRVIPVEKQPIAYMQWAKEYKSDVLSFKILNQRTIVLSSAQVAKDLLATRSANYSDRPGFNNYRIMGFVKNLVLARWGPEFRLHRRVVQNYFLKLKSAKYKGLQERQVRLVLRRLLNEPTATVHRVMARFSAAVVMGISYGVTITDDESPYLRMTFDASFAIGNGGYPTGSLVELFPFLVHLPRWFHDKALRFAMDSRPVVDRFHRQPFEEAKKEVEKRSCLVHDLLSQIEQEAEKGITPKLKENDIEGLAAVLNVAGYDTTWSTTIIFYFSMLLHPEVQTKARNELDKVVGRDRLPTIDDRPNLPYIDYVVNEVFRWIPAVPLGVPHVSLQDDLYDGFFIPGGSIIVTNTVAMTHDERIYSDPDVFDPDRYAPVDKGGKGEPFPVGPFGFGRRICPGRHLAEATVWITVASVLSTMTIDKALDERGNPITPAADISSGFISHLAEFPCHVRPRDEKSIDLINRIPP